MRGSLLLEAFEPTQLSCSAKYPLENDKGHITFTLTNPIFGSKVPRTSHSGLYLYLRFFLLINAFYLQHIVHKYLVRHLNAPSKAINQILYHTAHAKNIIKIMHAWKAKVQIDLLYGLPMRVNHNLCSVFTNLMHPYPLKRATRSLVTFKFADKNNLNKM